MRRKLLLISILWLAALALAPGRDTVSAKKKNEGLGNQSRPAASPNPAPSPSPSPPELRITPVTEPKAAAATASIWVRVRDAMRSRFTLVGFTCSLAWLILLLPAAAYLLTTWKYRKLSLFDRLPAPALKLYYEQFFPASAPTIFRARVQNPDIRKQFESDFGRLYGRRHYIFPLVLLAMISAIGLRLTSQSVQIWLGVGGGQAYPPIAISAFLGGYAWVLFDQFTRFRTGDFTPHDVYGAVYRFLIVIPLGISLSALLKDSTGVAVAFLLGAFPTTALMTIARRVANQQMGLGEGQQMGLGEGQERGALELEKLQGVGKSNAERYADEGITTISQLAWADPIELTIKTNRDFNFVVDNVSQALLWVYFEDKVKNLYPLSLRGAQEVCSLLDDLHSRKPKVKTAAEENLQAAAKLMGMDRESFLYALLVVRDDPYAQFLFKVWA